MAEWRISDEVPLRELDGLDHERCATLHNYIVELGWTQRGLALDTLDRRTWWQCYGGDAALASTAERLNPSVVSFLKAAWQGFAMDSASNPHLFHRYLGGLSTPEQLCRAIEYTEEEEDSNEPRYVLLYMANGALGTTHPLGLVLNQSEATAMQHMSIRDTEITMNGRQLWLPLEVILDGLVDMIEQGKILAVDATYSGEQERTEPWIMPSYTDRDLEESLQAFQQLVDAIHDRMPSKPQCRKRSTRDGDSRESEYPSRKQLRTSIPRPVYATCLQSHRPWLEHRPKSTFRPGIRASGHQHPLPIPPLRKHIPSPPTIPTRTVGRASARLAFRAQLQPHFIVPIRSLPQRKRSPRPPPIRRRLQTCSPIHPRVQRICAHQRRRAHRRACTTGRR